MNYTAAYEKSVAHFQEMSLAEIEKFSGYPVQGNQIELNFLGQKISVEYPSAKFEPEPRVDGELPIFARILILHYLCNHTGESLTGQYISYKELPGGGIYNQPFSNRAIRPMVEYFGEDPEKLLKTAQQIGGIPVKLGDAAVTLSIFPKIPVTLVLWRADEEFPASGNILFDRSASALLPTEDYAVLASFVVMALKKMG